MYTSYVTRCVAVLQLFADRVRFSNTDSHIVWPWRKNRSNEFEPLLTDATSTGYVPCEDVPYGNFIFFNNNTTSRVLGTDDIHTDRVEPV